MFKKIILFTLIIILIPLLIVGINDKEKIIYKIKYGSISNKKIRVKRTKTNEVVEVPIEEYVTDEISPNENLQFLCGHSFRIVAVIEKLAFHSGPRSCSPCRRRVPRRWSFRQRTPWRSS